MGDSMDKLRYNPHVVYRMLDEERALRERLEDLETLALNGDAKTLYQAQMVSYTLIRLQHLNETEQKRVLTELEKAVRDD